MNENTEKSQASTTTTGLNQAAAEGTSTSVSGNLSRFIDYTVIDRDRKRVGTLDSIWADHTGQPAYLAVRTGWLGFGKMHVVPAQAADVNESTKRVRLPYTEDQIKHAPAFDHQSDIDENAEMQIFRFYEPLGFRAYARPIETEPQASQAAAPAHREEAPTERMSAEPAEEGARRIQLSEEELRVGKRQVEYGGVRLRKIVRTETVNQPVDLMREEIVIERVPATEETQPAEASFKEEEEIYIPLRREEAVVAKEAHVREEVRIGRRSEVEHQNVTETVRKEDVEIEQEGSETETSRLGAGGRRPAATRYEPKERGKQ